jgi:hypothetical protein
MAKGYALHRRERGTFGQSVLDIDKTKKGGGVLGN